MANFHLEAGSVVHTASGDVYRVRSKVTAGDETVVRLSNLQGSAVPTPSNFRPISKYVPKLARALKFAFNADWDLYVKEYIRAAGLPVDETWNWAKWFQAKFYPSLHGDEEVRDEAIHQVIITALAPRSGAGGGRAALDPQNPFGFSKAIKKFPGGVQSLPLEKQVTQFLLTLFLGRKQEANQFIDKVQRPDSDSVEMDAPEESEDQSTTNVLDTEEHATPAVGQELAEFKSDMLRFRNAFAKWLGTASRPESVKGIVALLDATLYWVTHEHADPKISDLYPFWAHLTKDERHPKGLGFDSMKQYYSKLPKLVKQFSEEQGGSMEGNPIVEMLDKMPAKAEPEKAKPAKASSVIEDDTKGFVHDNYHGDNVSVLGSKTAEGVEKEFSEAKAEVVSPTTVDPDIKQPTEQVEKFAADADDWGMGDIVELMGKIHEIGFIRGDAAKLQDPKTHERYTQGYESNWIPLQNLKLLRRRGDPEAQRLAVEDKQADSNPLRPDTQEDDRNMPHENPGLSGNVDQLHNADEPASEEVEPSPAEMEEFILQNGWKKDDSWHGATWWMGVQMYYKPDYEETIPYQDLENAFEKEMAIQDNGGEDPSPYTEEHDASDEKEASAPNPGVGGPQGLQSEQNPNAQDPDPNQVKQQGIGPGLPNQNDPTAPGAGNDMQQQRQRVTVPPELPYQRLHVTSLQASTASLKLAGANKDVLDKLKASLIGDYVGWSGKFQEYIVKRGYFYTHGMTPERLAAAIKAIIPEAQITKTENHYHTWPKDSWFEVRFKMATEIPAATEPSQQETVMAEPVAQGAVASKRSSVIAKIKGRKAQDAKWAKLRQVAEDHSPEAAEALEQLGQVFGELADRVDAFRENLDLVDAPKSAHLKTRIAARRALGTRFRQIAQETPDQMGAAVNELFHVLDDVAAGIENFAENLGIELTTTPAESAFIEEGEQELHGDTPAEEQATPDKESSGNPELFGKKKKDPAEEEYWKIHGGSKDDLENSEDHKFEGLIPATKGRSPHPWEDVKKESATTQDFVTDRDESGQPKSPEKVNRQDTISPGAEPPK